MLVIQMMCTMLGIASYLSKQLFTLHKNRYIYLKVTTIMFIIFWDLLMVEQIFLSPQVKQGVIICNK